MSNEKRDLAFKKMSKYLLQKAEILQDECPNCHIPLLKLKNKIFCASCEKEVIYANSEESIEQLEYKMTNSIEAKSIGRMTETILLGKMENITNSLINQQGNELLLSLTILEKILTLLAKLKDIQN
jgi:uncharacterized Zn finger protein (UPF0148 family)